MGESEIRSAHSLKWQRSQYIMLLNNTASRFLLYYLLFITKSKIVTIQIQRVLPISKRASRSTTIIYATWDVGPAEYLLSVVTNIRLKQQDEWRQFMLASYYVNTLCPTLYNGRFFAASPVHRSFAFLRSSSSSLSISLRLSCYDHHHITHHTTC